jgi:hypothetical protein
MICRYGALLWRTCALTYPIRRNARPAQKNSPNRGRGLSLQCQLACGGKTPTRQNQNRIRFVDRRRGFRLLLRSDLLLLYSTLSYSCPALWGWDVRKEYPTLVAGALARMPGLPRLTMPRRFATVALRPAPNRQDMMRARDTAALSLPIMRRGWLGAAVVFSIAAGPSTSNVLNFASSNFFASDACLGRSSKFRTLRLFMDSANAPGEARDGNVR